MLALTASDGEIARTALVVAQCLAPAATARVSRAPRLLVVEARFLGAA